jgi:hypothetical protein
MLRPETNTKLHVVEELPPSRRRERRVLWICMIVGTLAAGLGMAYKVAEFIFTLSSDEARGFADVPVTVYFFMAGGWFALLAWAFLSGQMTDAERAKYDLLAQEEEYERRGE